LSFSPLEVEVQWKNIDQFNSQIAESEEAVKTFGDILLDVGEHGSEFGESIAQGISPF